MCIAVPGEIIRVFPRCATIVIMGIETTVNTQMIENPQIGDFILIHAGCAIEKVDKENYDDLLSIYNQFLDEDEKG